MNAQVQKVSEELGIGEFELFARAEKAYGEAKDSARTAYNKYTSFGEVPTFVHRFLHAHLGSNGYALSTMPVGDHRDVWLRNVSKR